MNACGQVLEFLVGLSALVAFAQAWTSLGIGLAIVTLLWLGIHPGLSPGYVTNAEFYVGITSVSVFGLFLGLAVLGGFGAKFRNACMLYTYGAALSVLFLAEIGSVVTPIIFKKDMENSTKQMLISSTQDYGHDGSKLTWDVLQSTLQCCGVVGYQDWKPGVPDLPQTCCQPGASTGNCGAGIFDVSNPGPALSDYYHQVVHDEGCFSKAKRLIVEYNLYISLTMGGLILLQFVMILLVFCLAHQARKKDKKAYNPNRGSYSQIPISRSHNY